MKWSRRQFVTAGAAVLAGGAAGCDQRAGTPDQWRRWLGHPAAPELPAVLTPPAGAELDAVSHVLNRLTFGPRPGDHARVTAMGIPAFIEEQLAPEALPDAQCERLVRHEFEDLSDPAGTLFRRSPDAHDPIEALFPAVMNNSGGHVGDLYDADEQALLRSLTRASILRATLSTRQLYEQMVEFWSDHFNIDPSKGECKWLKAADDREVIRKHALGKFSDLLRASALSPAMLWYLDGRANRRSRPEERPNENYARELMELHTLGVHGGYTQRDVMEVARCLTGWTVRDRKQWRKGTVEFDAKAHDDGEKTVLGQTIPAGLGLQDLDRVLGIVARHPATAQFIATKLCRRFLADEPPAAAVAATAGAFTASDGDLRATLRALFATPEFAASRGQKLKRPFHFVVSALRATAAATDGGTPIIEALLRLGQAPFRYPTPDGYPQEATHWTGTLLWRWNFAHALAEGRLRGTEIEARALEAKLGGPAGVMATCLGRQPTERELAAAQTAGATVAVALAAPAFQRC